ncbi:Pentatricopeptide repeat-containing protein At1g62930, chloroplastic [Linum grandiflorum]
MESAGIRHDLYTLSMLTNCFCRLGRVDYGFSVLGKVFRLGFEPNVVMFTTLIDGLCKDGNVVQAVKLLDKIAAQGMKAKGVSPDAVTYNCLIRCLCDLKQWERSVMLLNEMVELNILPTVVTCNTLVDAYCKEGKVSEATTLLGIMIRKGVHPDIVTFSSLIEGYCLQGRLDEAKKLFNSITSMGHKQDVYCYSIMINGYCGKERLDEAKKLFDEMPEKGLVPNKVTYTALMDGFCREGRTRDAQALLKNMCDRGYVPDIRTYNVLLDDLLKKGQLDAARTLFEVLECNNIVISGHCELGLVDEAYELFRKMEDSGCLPTRGSYNVLIRGFLRHKDALDAVELIQVMMSRGFSVDGTTMMLLIQLLPKLQLDHPVLKKLLGSDEEMTKRCEENSSNSYDSLNFSNLN